MSYKPQVLVILDGFGYSPDKTYNAIAQAKMPNYKSFISTYPHAFLKASEEAVGLLSGYIGNSEVGHQTIGSGQITKEAISVVHDAIKDHSFFKNKILIENLQKLHANKKTLHIMGLMSDGGVHSHINQLFAYIQTALDQGVESIVIHAFLDGRDVAPKSCHTYLTELEKRIRQFSNVKIASIHGRYYAMDRDKNWERTKESYDVLTIKQAPQFDSWQGAIEYYYNQGITDEFIPPTKIAKHSIITDHDGIIFYNVRADRARQLTEAFVVPKFVHFSVKSLKLTFFITPVGYGQDIPTTRLYPLPKLQNTLKEVISRAKKTIFSIAETEKYAHITYFFSGRHEEAFEGETRVLIPSLELKQYAHYPQMRTPEITQAVLQSLQNYASDFYLINYANADMVGHSGDLTATIKAVECIDQQLHELYIQVVQKMNGTLYITSDHGNAESKFDPKINQVRTSHTTNPVPFIMIKQGFEKTGGATLPLKQLSDIAPFILQQMNLPIPEEMKKTH